MKPALAVLMLILLAAGAQASLHPNTKTLTVAPVKRPYPTSTCPLMCQPKQPIVLGGWNFGGR